MTTEVGDHALGRSCQRFVNELRARTHPDGGDRARTFGAGSRRTQANFDGSRRSRHLISEGAATLPALGPGTRVGAGSGNASRLGTITSISISGVWAVTAPWRVRSPAASASAGSSRGLLTGGHATGNGRDVELATFSRPA